MAVAERSILELQQHAKPETGRFPSSTRRNRQSPLAIVASESERRKAAVEHHAITHPNIPNIPVISIGGTDEDESLRPSDIAKNKIKQVLGIVIDTLPPDKDFIVVAADVKITTAGGDPKTRMPDEESIRKSFLDTALWAMIHNTDPTYCVEAGSGAQYRKEGKLSKPYVTTETSNVILDKDRFEEIALTQQAFDEYKSGVEQTEIRPLSKGSTPLLDIAGGLSLAGLVRVDAVKSLTVKGVEVPRYIRSETGERLQNPDFIKAFKQIYYMQAVGFSDGVIQGVLYKQIQSIHGSPQEALAVWGWIEEVTKRTFDLPDDLPEPKSTQRRSKKLRAKQNTYT